MSVSATRDRERKSVVLHLVNPGAAEKPVDFALKGGEGLGIAKVTSLSAPSLEDRNPPDDPERISPVDDTEAFRGKSVLRPYSYTVVEFR